jgi:hypothetical protein
VRVREPASVRRSRFRAQKQLRACRPNHGHEFIHRFARVDWAAVDGNIPSAVPLESCQPHGRRKVRPGVALMVDAQSFTDELGQIRGHLLAADHGLGLQLGRRLCQLGAEILEFVVEPIRGDELKADSVQCVSSIGSSDGR